MTAAARCVYRSDGAAQCHPGDELVLEKLPPDTGRQQQVMDELRRIEWLDERAAELEKIVDVVWERAKPDT
eukprot:SAG11_NODE_979_length_6319_cov_2.950322_8_plen_71_part_00